VLPHDFMVFSLMKTGSLNMCYSDPEFLDIVQGQQDFTFAVGARGWFWEKGRPSITLKITYVESADGKREWQILRQVKTANMVGIRWTLGGGQYKAIPGFPSAADILSSNWTDGESLSLRPSLFQAPTTGVDAESKLLDEMRGSINEQRSQFFKTLDASLTGKSRLSDALNRLSGAKELVQSYVNLTLSSISDDELNALLFGNESLVDGDMVLREFAAARKSPNPDYDRARRLLSTQLDRRVDRLENVLASRLSEFYDQGNKSSHVLVDRTVSRLLLLQTVRGKD